jgi:Na+/H+ antiporter NhaD/arsenite permease-like protein
VLLSLLATYALLARRLRERDGAGPPTPTATPTVLDRAEAVKAVALTAAAIALFLTPTAAHLTALAVAGVVLTSRKMHTRTMLGLVDWQMLALFVALFVVTRGLEISGWAAAARDALAGAGLALERPAVLVPVVAGLGTVVGNVPAVMLLLRFVPAEPAVGYALALASTFAGNAVLVGSIANLIVVEQAARLGIAISFRDHLRVGVPVTAVSLAFAALALAAV